jgi:integrase
VTKSLQPVINRISQANGRLKVGKIGVKIEIKGDRLYFRATLPPKPGSEKQAPHQQRIALGIHANVDGVKLAEQKAREVGAAIDAKTFTWEPYQKTKPVEPMEKVKTVADWIDEFSRDYFQKRATSPASETTFQDCLVSFNRLAKDQPLTIEGLIDAILTTDPDSSPRRKTVNDLSRLAKFAGLSANLAAYRGNYSAKKVNPRLLPTDETIIELHNKLTGAAAWCYGMMAAYGLRNHEVFHLDLINMGDNGEIRVLDSTKTGYRIVFPCLLKWVDEWNLMDRQLPFLSRPATTYENEYLGDKIRRLLDLPFTPYNLRHCYARRTFEQGWPTEMAANMMGHSLTIHTKIYHAWISGESYREIYKKLSK